MTAATRYWLNPTYYPPQYVGRHRPDGRCVHARWRIGRTGRWIAKRCDATPFRQLGIQP